MWLARILLSSPLSSQGCLTRFLAWKLCTWIFWEILAFLNFMMTLAGTSVPALDERDRAAVDRSTTHKSHP